MTEMEFIYLLPRYFQTLLCLFILYVAPLQTVLARVTRDGTICAKNSHIWLFRWNQLHNWKRYLVTVSSPNYGS